MSYDDPFGTPSSDFVKLADADRIDHLVLVTPASFEAEVTTVQGKTDQVTVDFVDLSEMDDEDNPGVLYTDSRVFSRALVATLKRGAKFNEANPAGNPATGLPMMVLGVVGQGEAKKGQSAPWILTQPTDEQKVTAREYINRTKTDDPF